MDLQPIAWVRLDHKFLLRFSDVCDLLPGSSDPSRIFPKSPGLAANYYLQYPQQRWPHSKQTHQTLHGMMAAWPLEHSARKDVGSFGAKIVFKKVLQKEKENILSYLCLAMSCLLSTT